MRPPSASPPFSLEMVCRLTHAPVPASPQVKTLLAQLRDTQALFAASVLHAGIASASLSASETKSLALKAELKRLKGELREAERAAERTARELDGVRRGEKEAKDRLGRYAEELKVRDARAVGRREGRNEVRRRSFSFARRCSR